MKRIKKILLLLLLTIIPFNSFAISEYYVDKTGKGCHKTPTGRFFVGDGKPYTPGCTEIFD